MCFKKQYGEKTIHGTQCLFSYFYLIKTTQQQCDCWFILPVVQKTLGGGEKQHVTFWGVNGHCCVSGPLFIIVTLAYFVTHWISHSLFFLHLFPLVLLLCLIFSIFLSLSQAKQRLIPLVSNRDNHGNRPQLLSFGSVGQRHWSGWNSVMWKHKTHNWQMCTHVCVFVLGQKKKNPLVAAQSLV